MTTNTNLDSNVVDSAVEMAYVAGKAGYQTANSRDAMSQFIVWAAEFEKQPYEIDEWIEKVGAFAEKKMIAEVQAGRAIISDARLFKSLGDMPEILQVQIGLHKALSRMIDKHDPDSIEAEWLSHSNEVVRNFTGMDVGNKQLWDKIKKGGTNQHEFDPISPEGYVSVMANPELLTQYQNVLDSHFTERVAAVRRILTEKGWDGKNHENNIVNKFDNVGVYFTPTLIGKESKVIGGVWEIVGPTHESGAWGSVDKFMDGLAKPPEFIAAKIHTIQEKFILEISRKEAEQIGRDKILGSYVGHATADKKYIGKIIGDTNCHVVLSLGPNRLAMIFEKQSLDVIPAKDDSVTIHFKNGKGIVQNEKSLNKGLER